LIVAAFMVGMALGSWFSRRQRQDDRGQLLRLVRIQAVATIVPFLISGLLMAFTRVDIKTVALLVSALVFPLLGFLSGFLGGYQFPLVSRLFYQGRSRLLNPGIIYGLDILGAWCASLLLSILFLPLYGLFACTLLIAAVNAGPLLLAVMATRRKGQG
jgi:predicted membrane-bound spermidine synthase